MEGKYKKEEVLRKLKTVTKFANRIKIKQLEFEVNMRIKWGWGI